MILNKYVTNFTRTCFDHWSASKAINEFVQNYLDSDGEQYNEFSDHTIVLRNKNIRVSNKMLLMGLSDKRGDDTKRGCFGVGSIQSMVVLIDLDYDVSIQNNDVVWIPEWEYSEVFETDVMVINEYKAVTPNNHFTVTITGLEDDIVEEVKQRSLAFQDREVLYSTKYGDIINNVDENGEVYVGDLYVCQHKSFNYSYNIKPKILKLSQDRDAVSEWDLQELTAKIIVATEDVEFIKAAILSEGRDTKSINNYAWEHERATPESVNEALASEWLEEHKGSVITNDYDEHEKNIKLGNKSVYHPNKQLVNAIQKADSYQESLGEVEIVEEETIRELIDKLLDKVQDLYDDKAVPNEDMWQLADTIRIRLDTDSSIPF